MNTALQSKAKPVSTPALVSIPVQKTLQTKLLISSPNDEYELEADHAAEHVTAGFDFSRVRIHTGTPGFMLQREQGTSSNEPLIPIPVFDQFDPVIIVPDIEGIPSFLRGRQVPLSTLRSALDVFMGRLPSLSPSPGRDFCSEILPGYETAQSGELAGFCCPRFRRDQEVCCRQQDIGIMSFRCCRRDEVVVNDRCVRPQPAPAQQVAPPVPGLPPIPRLELQTPRIRFGTIQSESIDHFTLNEYSLPSGASEKLDRLAGQLNLYREVEVHIEGHTDSSYTREYNQRLSEQRAQAVRDALVRRGIDASRLIVTGYGETRLLFPEERTQEEKARNRRVDVWFYIPPSRSMSDELLMRRP
ncbi:OmpA family protein [uncultured archaeon]|nr:OmpA family protein [uncultured archaeon]